ncbi:serine/arginine repetitive matrix protein 1 [Sorghum bicolor]|uniref:HhH-GPD domain-containing protein n=1 Tax=Sorghum bicolor TaxID=4558 RepID=C5WNB1_SORBI|nr:serine/arginine repetitive matrix protein 1 [Sorghum bicolor]EER94314.1 hypothetical protein SORBI_3001G262900 [Sorghum bicolor]|eukprot:XP_002467316.1 serine/arginine repetitive matrix protein 1 [Sorghum bicolor]
MSAPAEDLEASRQKKRRRKKHREQEEAIAASSKAPRPPTTPESKRESTVPVAPETLASAGMAAAGESPRPPANPESKSESPVPVATETLTSVVMVAAAAVSLVKERERKNQVAPPACPLMEESVGKEEKRRKKRKHGEAAVVIPSTPTPAAAQNLQMESKVMAAVRKKQRRRMVEHEQSRQPPFPVDVHPQAGEEAAAACGGIMGSQCVKRSSSKKSQVLKKQQPLPQGFFPPTADPNFTDQDPNYSSPFGAFFAQFAYKPDRRKDGSGPPLPNTVDRAARLPPQGHPSPGSSLLTAKVTSKAARTTTSNTKQPCPASASTSGSQEEVRIKQKEKPKVKMTREIALWDSPCPVANPEYMSDSPVPVTPETLTSVEMIVGVKERERKNQEALPASPLMEEPVWKEEKKHKKRKNGEAAVVIPSPPTAAMAQILQRESKVTAEGVTLRKKHRQPKVEHEQFGQLPLPIDVHPQAGEEAAAAGGIMGSQCVKRSSSKKSQVLKKQQPLPQGFFPPMADPNFTDQDPNYSSPFGAFFAQFAYKPDRRKDGSGLPLPNTADRPARLPPRGHPSSRSSLLTAKESSKAARTTTSNTMQPCPASASTSGSQEGIRVKGIEKPEKMMTMEKKPRRKSPLLSAAEKRSDKYRRLPLDQLVPPPCSPHKLLQENYASDPWKVIVICMLLNLTQGKQVEKKVNGFFERYPDPQTAYRADPKKMAEYLAPLGFQRVKTKRIQKFSKAYVGEEWTYITELCGVGKYAADAYAIFCAGRANEVVPKDHKLVDYWNYVCFELPSIQKSKNVQEAGVMGLGNLVP